jgi:hypothetical protein
MMHDKFEEWRKKNYEKYDDKSTKFPYLTYNLKSNMKCRFFLDQLNTLNEVKFNGEPKIEKGSRIEKKLKNVLKDTN